MRDVDVQLGVVPRKWQQEVSEHMKRFTVIAVHRRGGKTVLACNILAQQATTKEDCLFGYIAPERAQAKVIAWDVLKRIFDPFVKFQEAEKRRNKSAEDVITIMESELKITFNKTGSSIQLFGADNPDRIRGVKLAGVVMDEVAQMKPETWYDAVRPALMDSNGWALFIGTPKGVNLFSELFNMPATSDLWYSKAYTCEETGALPPEEIEEYKRTVPEEVFRREMLCDFSASADNQVISLSMAKSAINRDVDPTYAKYSTLVLGIDVARYGKDKTVLFFRKGYQAYPPIMFNHMDFYQQAIHIKEICDEKQPRAIFVDGTGMGCGLPDFLRAFGMNNVFDVNFSGVTSDQQYFNTRCMLWFKLQEWLKQGGSIPDDQNLVQELAMPLYEAMPDGKYKLEAKEAIKKRLHGKSPDRADALALTFFVDFDKNMLQEHNPFVETKVQTVVDDINPFTVFEDERRNDRGSIFTAMDFR